MTEDTEEIEDVCTDPMGHEWKQIDASEFWKCRHCPAEREM